MEATKNNNSSSKLKEALPQIPNKRYFNIGEMSFLCAVKPHVLRYWEQEFRELRPSKRKGNRRYYQLKDVEIARQIKELLYDKGFTIQGARQYLAELRSEKLATVEAPSANKAKTDVENIIKDLEDILAVMEPTLSQMSTGVAD